jgi:DNA helicase-2/ATP-dependent DNA helicase PcrA
MLFGRTTSNCLSRFVKEVPDAYIEKPHAEPRLYGIPNEEDSYSSYRSAPKPERHVSHIASAAPQKPSMAFQQGDSVKHKAFGIGIIKSVRPVGGDALVEIEFKTAGIKRLMLKAAAAHMVKI